MPERIFHIATASEWRTALGTGTYATSTVGRTLEEEGFIHASRRDQVPGVFERYYRSLAEDLVLLTIDPTRLTSEVRMDPVGDDTYPHVYGPIEPRAVVDAVPLSRTGQPETVMSLWIKGMARRMGIALAVMLVIAAVLWAVALQR
ncbi:DUF952 domain-containing protein [Nocardioides hwasunensis]|uniref:DUF952 domain-containing protein n=1 Tax=Nocardioides hwasunensis TaxID=397258 RepID=A0ABR8MLX6_9ACTN|nr:DUF952 domain-containing protein [Nocardioides hwasunensis]